MRNRRTARWMVVLCLLVPVHLEIQLSADGSEWQSLAARHEALLSASPRDAAAEEAAYIEARLAKRLLLLRDPELAPLENLLFVKRHPFAPSHNYSVILDARGGPGGGVCRLEIPRRDGREMPGSNVARGSVKYIRVCQEVRADLVQLPDGRYQADHEPFRDWYAAPIHHVSGPNGWPSYVAKGTFGRYSTRATTT